MQIFPIFSILYSTKKTTMPRFMTILRLADGKATWCITTFLGEIHSRAHRPYVAHGQPTAAVKKSLTTFCSVGASGIICRVSCDTPLAISTIPDHLGQVLSAKNTGQARNRALTSEWLSERLQPFSVELAQPFTTTPCHRPSSEAQGYPL
jgi:hypothetical protein